MTSSEEALRLLEGWKVKKTALHLEFSCPGENSVSTECARILDTGLGWATIIVGEAVLRDLHFDPVKGVEITETVPQRFRSRVIKVSSIDGEVAVLGELFKT